MGCFLMYQSLCFEIRRCPWGQNTSWSSKQAYVNDTYSAANWINYVLNIDAHLLHACGRSGERLNKNLFLKLRHLKPTSEKSINRPSTWCRHIFSPDGSRKHMIKKIRAHKLALHTRIGPRMQRPWFPVQCSGPMPVEVAPPFPP